MFEFFWPLMASGLVLAGISLLCFSRNIVHSCFYLFLVFIGIGLAYLSLQLDFLAVTQLVVYGGGVVMILLFAIMLTGGNEQTSFSKNILNKLQAPLMGNLKQTALALIVSFIFLGALVYFLFISDYFSMMPFSPQTIRENQESLTFSLGMILGKQHIFIFEFSSLLLLGALIVAAAISRPEKEEKESVKIQEEIL